VEDGDEEDDEDGVIRPDKPLDEFAFEELKLK
jgi:hypothetical protein